MEKSERTSQPNSAQSNDTANFPPVLSAINLKCLPTYCAATRKASADFVENQGTPIEPITVESPPLVGSYHALFPIRFYDGLQWVLKILTWGTSEHFNESVSSAL
ncbi:hypothetical protein EMPG_10866 [Blastomyces silverae]|uniref:Uncharacterized protein n=1 Tax=Blastomyces silverae TaxID=2060906 RepID=A0A0H1B3V5_9EURO|nr:hypothetical protein EMPG_10866 [Blastomyces silverae]